MRMNRHDMLVEIVSEMLNSVEQLSIQGSRVELEAWLAPIMHNHYAHLHANESDESIADLYEREIGTIPMGWEEQ